MEHLSVGFIGFGLIGGSVAKALKARCGADIMVSVYDTDTKSVAKAFEDGIADRIISSIGPDFAVCDYIFLCAPVGANIENAAKVRPFMKDGAVLTDVGSVKGRMQRSMVEMGFDDVFVGGHPMAGSERVGYLNSKENLFTNAYYLITRTERTPDRQVEGVIGLAEAVGAIPLIMSPEEHDRVVAAVSHVPHIISASLVNLVRDSDTSGDMHRIAAGGFKDITRIQSSSPVMWQQICLANGEMICSLLRDYIASLQDALDDVERGDAEALIGFFDGARTYRDSFDSASRGPIKSSNSVHVELLDRPGELAVALTMVASLGLNIKNIGIVHNREVESGVISISFYDSRSAEDAYNTFREHGYDATLD